MFDSFLFCGRLLVIPAQIALTTIAIFIAQVQPLLANTQAEVSAIKGAVERDKQRRTQNNTPLTLPSQEVEVKEVRFVGNTVFTDPELRSLIDLSPGETIFSSDLIDLREKVTDYYVEQGYVSTSAVVSSQRPGSGIIEVQILEGTLKEIRIEGTNYINNGYLYSRLPKVGQPLNQNELLDSLARLQDDPMIEDVRATLTESDLAQNVVVLTISEQKRFRSSFGVSNSFSRSVGTLGGSADANYNLFGIGDNLNVGYTRTEGLERFDTGYSVVLGKQNTQLTLAYADSDTEIIEDPISDLDIQGDYQTIRLGVRQPVRLSDQSDLAFTIEGEVIDSEAFIQTDDSFSFVEGLPDGESDITALRLSQEYFTNNDSRSVGVRSQFNVGLPIFDATETEVGIDGLFWSWQGQGQYLQRLGNSNLILASRLNIQLTPDRLLPLEQLTLGGLRSVRGYRQNLSIGDNGVIGNVELQIPVLGNPESHFVRVIPFVAAGTLWNNGDEEIPTETIASVGVGASYQLGETIEAQVDLALPLVDANAPPDFDTEQIFTFQLFVRP